MSQELLLILGSYGQSNFGDEAILRVILEQLPPGKYRIAVNSDRPQITQRQYRNLCVIPTAFWKGFGLKLYYFFSTRTVLFGGGTLLIEHQRRWYNYYRYGTLLRLLFIEMASTLFRKKVIWFCVGAGPLQSRLGKLLARWCIRFTHDIIVRDTLSAELIGSLAPFKPIHLGADPTLVFQKQESSLQTSKGALLSSVSPPFICLAPQWWVADLVHQTTDIIKEFSAYVTYVVSQLKGSVLLLPFQCAGPKNDLWLNRKIKDNVSHPSVHILEDELEPDSLLTIFERADLVVGLRLHALIFALLAGRPMIALDYEPKVKGFVSDIGQRPYLVELEPDFAEKLIMLTNEILSRPRAATSGIAEPVVLDLKKRAMGAFAELKRYL